MSKIVTVLVLILGVCVVENNSDATEKKVKAGKGAAGDYFKKRQEYRKKRALNRRKGLRESQSRSVAASSASHYLALHLGGFLEDKAYRWGEKSTDEDVGNLTVGVTYRVGEWKNSMDLFFRADVVSYEVDDEKPTKLSVMPVVTFPDASSQFPLYFGAGAGLGVFFKQAQDESSLSFDYQVLVGGRFFDVFDQVGLLFETGLKNHIHLLSDGQYNGVFLSAGTVFDF